MIWNHLTVYEALKARGLEQSDYRSGSGKVLKEAYAYLWSGQITTKMEAILSRPDSKKYATHPLHIHSERVPKDSRFYIALKPLLKKWKDHPDANGFMSYSVPAENWSKVAEILGLIDSGQPTAEVAGSRGPLPDAPTDQTPGEHKNSEPSLPPTLSANFSPELDTPTTAHREASVLEVKHDHGVVTNKLEELLRISELITGNDKRQDLIIIENGRVKILFEVKSNASTQSVYTCIGQLMYYGALQVEPPLRVAVLPDEVNEEVRLILKKLGIRLVTFRRNNNQPVFDGYESILQENGL